LISVGFGYGDGDELFLWRWVWDSETRPRPAPLPSLCSYPFKFEGFVDHYLIMSFFDKNKQIKDILLD